MKKKLTPALEEKIRARRRQGMQIADLRREFGLGLATIHKALKGSTGSRPAPAPAAEQSESTAPDAVPTREELLGYLSSQAKSLREDAARATDPSTRAAANRNLIAVQALITKLVPPPAEPEGMMLVSVAEMQKGAAKGEEKLATLIRNTFADHLTWPVCPACKRPVPPSAEELERRINDAKRDS